MMILMMMVVTRILQFLTIILTKIMKYLVSDDYLDIDDYHSLLGVGVLAASLKVATTAL